MVKDAPKYLGGYRLHNIIHASRTCLIWQASDDRNNRLIGIKALREDFAKHREHVNSLRWEYTISRKTLHPRIIEIFSFGTDKGVPFLAMEWYPSPNMKYLIQQGTEKIRHLLPKIIEQAAEGLGSFNERGYVHRDVKPDNFLVGNDGEVKLIDLALAVKARRGLARLFAPRSKVQGTRSYMSPEQIRGRVLDQRADVYSFACTIHELVCGKPPFTGTSSNELLNKHLKTPPPSLENVERNVTPEFAKLIQRGLAKEPAKRPASVGEFLADFRQCRVFKIIPRPPA